MGFETKQIELLSTNIKKTISFKLVFIEDKYIDNTNEFFIEIKINGLTRSETLSLQFNKYKKNVSIFVSTHIPNIEEISYNCVISLITNKIINCHFDWDKIYMDKDEDEDNKEICWSLS